MSRYRKTLSKKFRRSCATNNQAIVLRRFAHHAMLITPTFAFLRRR